MSDAPEIDWKSKAAENAALAERHMDEIVALWKELNAERSKGPSLDEYQEHTSRTDGQKEAPLDKQLSMGIMGLCGEAGEVTELVKKFLFHGHGLDQGKFRKELGDVLYYLARLAAYKGLKLSDVAAENTRKLQERYPDGFSAQASINRKEEPNAKA